MCLLCLSASVPPIHCLSTATTTAVPHQLAQPLDCSSDGAVSVVPQWRGNSHEDIQPTEGAQGGAQGGGIAARQSRPSTEALGRQQGAARPQAEWPRDFAPHASQAASRGAAGADAAAAAT